MSGWLLGALKAVVWPTSVWLRLVRGGLWLLACVLVFHLQARVFKLDINVVMETPPTSVAQVFYSFNGSAFFPENNQVMRRGSDSSGTTFRTVISSYRPIKAIRLDPLNMTGDLAWASITFTGVGDSREFGAKELGGIVRSSMQLTALPESNGRLNFLATGADPQMTMMVPNEVNQMSAGALWSYGLKLLVFGLVCLGLLEVVTRVLHPAHWFTVRSKAVLDRAAAALSEEATIRFSRSSLIVLIALFVLASLWVGLKLHQSSVGMWDSMFPQEHVERTIDLGKPKVIRTDEWNSFTPWVLSQVQMGMPDDNPNLGAPASPILTGSPVLGPLMIAQPKYWGFLALEIERGFSWMWATKAFGMVTAFFLLLLALTKGDTAVSLAGALSLYGSSYVQWWYSSLPPEIIAGFSMAIVGTIYLLQAKKTGGLIFGAVILSLAVPNLLLHLYPPYLLSLIYLSVFLLTGHLVQKDRISIISQRLPLRLVLAVLILVVWTYCGLTWYFEARDTIKLMMNTEYPGQRYAMGGDRSLVHIFYGFFESWQTTEDIRPFQGANNPEVSAIWMLFPLAFLIVPAGRWLNSAYRLPLALMAFCILVVLWASGPLPQFFRAGMAAAGWHLTSSARAMFSLGIASNILIAVLASGVARGELKVSRMPWAVSTSIAFVVVFGIGLVMQAQEPVFFTDFRLMLGSLFVAAFAFAVHRGRRYLFLLLSVAVAIPMLYVNPLQSGIDSYLNKGLFVSARQATHHSSDRWAVFGSMQVAQGLKSAGLNVLNGTHFAPRLSMLQIFDPDLKFKPVWNRYAHIELREGSSGELPEFETVFLDHYAIKLDVCGPHIRAAGVTLLAFDKPPSASALECLQLIPTHDNSLISLYRFKSTH